MLRMTTRGNSRSWHFGKCPGWFSYPMLLNYPAKWMVPEESGCAAGQGLCCSPMSAPIWPPQWTERV